MAADTIQFTIAPTAGGGVTNTFNLPLHKLDATTAPVAGDDDADGYVPGSIWMDVTANKSYICVDNATGSAIWTEITAAGGASAPTDAEYLVKTAHGSLSAERVATDNSFFAFDWSTSGQVGINFANQTGMGIFARATTGSGAITFETTTTAGHVLRIGAGGASVDWNFLDTICYNNNSVTYAKMQDISATQRLLGRNTAGAGDTEEVPMATALAWLGNTQGNILHRDGSSWTILATGSVAGEYLKGGGAGANVSWSGSKPGPRSKQIFTSGTAATYTTPSGCIAIRVTAVGGGGSGGGAGNTAAQVAPASGGGAGGVSEKWFFSPAATYTYTVGAAGTTASAGNNPGNAGGTTTFDTMTALGGTAGGGGTAGTGLAFVSAGGSNGAGANADVASAGEGGGAGIRLSASVGQGGNGGTNRFGAGGGARSTAGAGVAGTGYGAGGGGGLSTGGGTQAGGAATGGLILVEEYY